MHCKSVLLLTFGHVTNREMVIRVCSHVRRQVTIYVNPGSRSTGIPVNNCINGQYAYNRLYQF